MVLKNSDGTYTFKNGVTAKLVNGKYELVHRNTHPQTGGRVSMPSEYFGNMTGFYKDIPTNNDVVNPNAELPGGGDLARSALPTSQQFGGSGEHKLDFIYDIHTNKKVYIFSNEGKNLLKNYIQMSKKQEGGYYDSSSYYSSSSYVSSD